MHPQSRDKPTMTAVASDTLARQWARQLEDREIACHGLTRIAARAKVARHVGVTPGTLENLSRSRLKGVREWLYSRLLAAVTASAEKELAALQHEYQTLLALGQRRSDRAVQEVAQGIARLRGLLNEAEARI